MKALRCDARQNQLLAALPDAEWQRWQPHLDRVDLPMGQVLSEPGRTSPYVYFPTTAIISLLHMNQDGATAEIAVTGNEGVVGMSALMGSMTTPIHAKVQSSGQGYRLRAHMINREIDRGGPVLKSLLRYIQAMMAQLAQSAMCNRFHSIEQRLCRRLLLGLDRLPSDELEMTQELVASLLGVRRESVTTAALKLQQAGVIRYSRGHIVVLDRLRLEQRTCECYESVKTEYHLRRPELLAA